MTDTDGETTHWVQGLVMSDLSDLSPLQAQPSCFTFFVVCSKCLRPIHEAPIRALTRAAWVGVRARIGIGP